MNNKTLDINDKLLGYILKTGVKYTPGVESPLFHFYFACQLCD